MYPTLKEATFQANKRSNSLAIYLWDMFAACLDGVARAWPVVRRQPRLLARSKSSEWVGRYRSAGQALRRPATLTGGGCHALHKLNKILSLLGVVAIISKKINNQFSYTRIQLI